MANLNIPDCIGKKYGKLTILKESSIRKHRKRFFTVRCDCGKILDVRHAQLLNGMTKSCGCINKEWSWRNCKTHGMEGTPLYRRWAGMKIRCYNSNIKSYKDYGGRGIKMCEEWKNNFLSFYNWAINNGYESRLQIDRIDNNGNYEPNNCRFVTSIVNVLNRRNTILVEISGKKLPACPIYRKNNISQNTFYARLRKGWGIEKAMTEKVQFKSPRITH